MLTLLRKIRKSLIESGSTRKYLLYAIGEILLVMIGILLALQVSNWNQVRKDRNTEKEYLLAIQEDLKQDIAFISGISRQQLRKLYSYKYADSSFILRYSVSLDTYEITDTMFNLRSIISATRTYRPTNGTYSALISEGQSKLLQNRELFNKIQKVYELEMASVTMVGLEAWQQANALLWELRYEIRHNLYKPPLKITDKQLLADLDPYFNMLNFYAGRIKVLNNKIVKLIDEIGAELNEM